MRGAEAIRESRGQLGTKREGHLGPHSIGVSTWLHKLVALNPWMAHLMGPQKHCLGAVTLAFFFLVTPPQHSPTSHMPRPGFLVFLMWAQLYPNKRSHKKEYRAKFLSHDTENKTLPNGRNLASDQKSNLKLSNFSNLGCNGNHPLMSALSMYQDAAGLVRLMLVIKLWRWPQGVPHPAIFSRQHAPLCTHTCTHTCKHDCW